LFSREAFFLTDGGLVLGLCGYVAASVYLRRFLYDVRPWEPIAVAAVVLFVGFMAAIATAPAAYRAGRIDPGYALRSE
jgi:ABC-type lipoprotein release transport system permease subunit